MREMVRYLGQKGFTVTFDVEGDNLSVNLKSKEYDFTGLGTSLDKAFWNAIEELLDEVLP